MSANRIKLVPAILLGIGVAFLVLVGGAKAQDPIPGYLSQISTTNLTNVATDLVTLYGPRHWNTYSPYAGSTCNWSSIVYPKSTIEMAADYVKTRFEAMGYPSSAITFETLPRSAGRNVYVTKVGSVYPNVYIDFGAHLDSVQGAPGGSDDASGSTAVIELARVLKDYSNRYSMRFILFAAEEYDVQYGTVYYGSNYYIQQRLARGEQVKAGLIMDHIGWQNSASPTDYANDVSYNSTESGRIAGIFDQVRSAYGISIGYRTLYQISNSDNVSYWNFGQTAVQSGGGWLNYRPNYHDCGDTVSNINFTNVHRIAQQNLAVGLRLDAEVLGATSTPIPTATGPTPTPTSAPTSAPTSTPVPAGGFPSTGVIDTFNRADGAVGSAWSGQTAGYGIVSNQVRVNSGGEQDMYWNGTSYGAEQEAHVTLATLPASATEIGLVLKSQSSGGAGSGLIDVVYDRTGNRIQVWTYQSSQGWVQRGGNVAVTFGNGDQFGARARANGQVEVYRNGGLIGTFDVTGWSSYAQGGYIGLFMVNASGTVLDNFGGGNVGASPTATSVPPTATSVPPTATNTALPPTATSTAAAPTATSVPPTATDTPIPTTPTNTPVTENTGWLSPTANAAQTGGDGNGYEGSPANAYTGDGVFGTDTNSGTNTNTTCTNTGKDKHNFYNYDISIPGSAIDGIEVRLDARADATSGAPRICVQLSWDGGTTWTTAKTTATLTTSAATYILGSATDNWGRTWAAGNLSNANFRVRVIDVASSTARDFSLDWVAVRVTYH